MFRKLWHRFFPSKLERVYNRDFPRYERVVTHNLNSVDVQVSVYDIWQGHLLHTGIQVLNLNQVCIFGHGSGTIRCVVHSDHGVYAEIVELVKVDV